MKIAICGASIVDFILPNDCDFIGVDGGVKTLFDQGITPVYCIGDFDSLAQKELLTNQNVTILPTNKDQTDMQCAIEYAIQNGYVEIDLYGVTGGRIDHYMAVIAMLYKYHDCFITIYDQWNKIMALDVGEHYIDTTGYQYFSLFAWTDTLLTLRDCKYPIEDYLLTSHDPLCVSNEALNNTFFVKNSKKILTILSNSFTY